ncbi:hypothetical protein J437_LFUL005852 [Ladona fulva]|uniref:Uncharacterized protein n=1 Tax=Ladona fulva TaxID=123851 RepID=A0A8K0K7E7_LADFU|nr:hypothetical protein J437_LFUL005852 [Ladona fulva]
MDSGTTSSILKQDSRTCLNWKLFSDHIINKIHYYPLLEIPTTNDLNDTQIDLLNYLFNTTISKASYQAPVRPGYHIPLPSFLTSFITSRNRLRRKMIYSKNPVDKIAYKNLDKFIKTQIRLACNEHWTKLVNTLSFEDNSLWRITKSLNNPANFNQPFLINNELQFDTAIKVESAAQQLSSSMQNLATNPSTDPVANATSLMLSNFTPIDDFIQTTAAEIIDILLNLNGYGPQLPPARQLLVAPPEHQCLHGHLGDVGFLAEWMQWFSDILPNLLLYSPSSLLGGFYLLCCPG